MSLNSGRMFFLLVTEYAGIRYKHVTVQACKPGHMCTISSRKVITGWSKKSWANLLYLPRLSPALISHEISFNFFLLHPIYGITFFAITQTLIIE